MTVPAEGRSGSLAGTARRIFTTAAVRTTAVSGAAAARATRPPPARLTVVTTSPAETRVLRAYCVEPHLSRPTASRSSWSRFGSCMVTTTRGTRPERPEPTSTMPDCVVAPVLTPSPHGYSRRRLCDFTCTAVSYTHLTLPTTYSV